jgi:hypothetical protein
MMDESKICNLTCQQCIGIGTDYRHHKRWLIFPRHLFYRKWKVPANGELVFFFSSKHAIYIGKNLHYFYEKRCIIYDDTLFSLSLLALLQIQTLQKYGWHMTLFKQALSLIGLVFNFSIVRVTIKNKLRIKWLIKHNWIYLLNSRSLQNCCGVMLAIYSLLQVFIQIYIVLPTILTLTGTKSPLLVCFYASALQIFWAGLVATFTLKLDDNS